MPPLEPKGRALEVLLARFRSFLKPPAAVFTEQLPTDLESNPFLIYMVAHLLESLGFWYNESTSQDVNFLAHLILVIDFISVMKVERPDVIHFLLQPLSPPSISLSSSQTHPKQVETRTQFHHYIPRFILKTFADNFSLSNTEFITATSSPNLSGFTEVKPSKLRPKGRPCDYINVFRIEDHTTELANVARAYGADDMYRDVIEADCMKFEKLLAKHECTSSTFIRKIWNEEEDLSLSRIQLGDMKKFLVIMMYRSERRRSQYFNQRFDPFTEISLKRHMDHNKFSSVQAVWFENLKWIIKTPTEDIVKEYQKAIEVRAKSERPTALLSPYLGPIHASELEDFGSLMTSTIAGRGRLRIYHI